MIFHFHYLFFTNVLYVFSTLTLLYQYFLSCLFVIRVLNIGIVHFSYFFQHYSIIWFLVFIFSRIIEVNISIFGTVRSVILWTCPNHRNRCAFITLFWFGLPVLFPILHLFLFFKNCKKYFLGFISYIRSIIISVFFIVLSSYDMFLFLPFARILAL